MPAKKTATPAKKRPATKRAAPASSTKKKTNARGGKRGQDTHLTAEAIRQKNQIRAKDIVGAFAGETGMPGKLIGAIEIFDEFTYVDVPYTYAKEILRRMEGNKIKGRKVNVERAKKVMPRQNRKKDGRSSQHHVRQE